MKIAFHSSSFGTTARASDDSVMPVKMLQPSRSTISCALRTASAGLPPVSSSNSWTGRPRRPPLAFCALIHSSQPRFSCWPTEPRGPVKASGAPIGLEACGASHYWARLLLRGLGHEVVLLPPQYIKPYVKRGKNDANDAEAICEAMSRPGMRFVPIKSGVGSAVEQAYRRSDLFERRRRLMDDWARWCSTEASDTSGTVVAIGAAV